jgi:tetratricopeptide (TPR) repeat protein
VRAGALDRAAAHLDRALSLDPTVAAAWSLRAALHLWSLDLDSASRSAARALALDPVRLDALRVCAGVSVLREDYAHAHALLDDILARDGRDAEAWLWRAEALFREERLAESLAAVQCAGERSPEFTQYVAAQVVRFLAMIHQGTFRHLPRGVLEEVLAALCPDAVHARHVAFPHPPEVDEDPGRNARDTARLLEQALAALGGNRSFTPTWIDPYAEAPTFHPVALTTPPRTAAKRTLARVTVDDVETVRAAFERVIARYPRRDEPWLYVGELYLYAGRYPEARAAFQRALAHNPTARWAFIGLGAVDLGEGDARKALATWERGARVSGGEGPTLHVYRGEALRVLGRFNEARRDLENACASRPSRVSAWVNLALVHDAQGDRAEFDATVARVRRDAPEMLADAASEAGVTLPDPGEAIAHEDAKAALERALVMMRGNRSSAHPTWVTHDGHWRVSPTSPPGRGEVIDHDLLRTAAALVVG